MVFRLPTQLESFIPPPASVQLNASDIVGNPWRGQFLVSGTRASDIESNVEIRVTGAETDGDTPPSQSNFWPSQLVFSVTPPNALPIMAQLQTYLRHRSPPIPLTTFMPDRIRDTDQETINQSHFRSLSRILWDGQLVAVVAISLSRMSPASEGRHGILLFSPSNSGRILFGAVFLTPSDPFPDFVDGRVAMQSPSSFSSMYGSPVQRDRSSVGLSPSPPFISAPTPQYEQYPLARSPRSRAYPYPQGYHRQSSHSVSPTSTTESGASYRYVSPPTYGPNIPLHTQAAFIEPSHFNSGSRSQYSARSSEASSSDTQAAYQHPAQRGSSSNQPSTEFEQ